MINNIMDAVTRQLDSLFGNGYKIYTDEVTQGLEEPCFFVQILEPFRKPMIGRRSFQKTGFCIQYIPDKGSSEKTRELNQVAEILLDGMEYITLTDGDQVRGGGRSCKTENGVLSFFVDYHMFLTMPEEPKEAMEELEWKEVQGSGSKEKRKSGDTGEWCG